MPITTMKRTPQTVRPNRIEREQDEAQLAIMAALEAAGIEVRTEKRTLAALLGRSYADMERSFRRVAGLDVP